MTMTIEERVVFVSLLIALAITLVAVAIII